MNNKLVHAIFGILFGFIGILFTLNGITILELGYFMDGVFSVFIGFAIISLAIFLINTYVGFIGTNTKEETGLE